MQQTERKLFASDSQEYDYHRNPQVQTNPGVLSKFLFFNRLRMLYHYISKISKQTLYRYNDGFEPMISTNKILNDFKKESKETTPFSIASQIFKLEKRGIVTLIVLSIIAGLTSLVPIYFQFILVKAVMGNTGNYYSIAVIICVMFARFILLNYVLNLSNNIALNVKIHMQNTFVRAVFACKKFSPSSKYFDVDLVSEALYYVPYLITSQIIIIGDIVFVFLQVGVYGCIVLGIYIVLYIFIAICGKLAYEIMRENSGHRTERQQFQKRSLSGLLRVALERVQDYVYHLLVAQKALQTKQNLKINILYILGQTFGEACIVLSNITLYALTDQQGVGHMFSYYSVLFMVACFFPMRYSVYGFFTIIKAYEAYQRIDLNFANIEAADLHSLPNSVNERHFFAQNVGDCFEYGYQGEEQIYKSQTQSNLKSLVTVNESQENPTDIRNLDSLRPGQILMILTRVDSNPSGTEFLKDLIESRPKDKSLIMINSAHFILPLSLKDNILFYSPYDEVRFKKVLEITQLNNLPQKTWNQNRRLDDKNLKYNEWHQSRIELARALYNNVDYLILNKQNLLDDLSLLTSVFADRKANNKVTIVANNTHKYYFKLADRILALGRRGQRQIGTYKELHMRRDSLFNLMFLRHHEKVDHSSRILQERKTLIGNLHIAHKEPHESHLQKSTFFEFFNFVHRKAEFIILITVFLPPCFKYYLQYLIGTSVTTNIFWRYLIFGLIYIFFIFVRGFFLSIYTNLSSLSLFRKICRKLNRLNAHQILEFYQNPHVDFDFHSRIIDRNLVMDFQYGQSILVQIIVSFIVYCTGQPIYIAVAIPIIVGIVFINAQYMKHARMIYLLKIKETKEIYRLIASAVDRRLPIEYCLKADQFNQQFHKQNRVEIIYNSNVEWLQTGVRTLAELIVLIAFAVFLIIMINTVQNASLYTSLVSLGCSMFINLLYLNTFYLKTFRQMEISLVSLTLCMSFLKDSPHPSPRQLLREVEPQNIKQISIVESIQFNQVSLRCFPRSFNKISLKIQGGDRLVLSGNSNTHKQLIFYMLQNRLFDCEEIRGDLVINGEIHRQFSIDGLYFLHSNPIIPFIGTLFDAVRYSKPSIEQSELNKQFQEFFQVMDLKPVFGADTEVQTLAIEQKQLFELFRMVVIKECKILVIINGLDNIDIVSRRKLMKWLIKLKTINILIETTNVREMIELYPKRYVLQDDRIVQEEGQNLKELYLKKLQTNQNHQSSNETQKDEKQFDSMLRKQLKKHI